MEKERKDTLYEIVEHWLQHIESEEKMHEICEEIMKLDCHDFANNIEVINKHLGDLNEDGDFDGVAMEIEEWFADNDTDKDFSFNVDLHFTNLITAQNKEEAIDRLKASFIDDYNLEITDEEITYNEKSNRKYMIEFNLQEYVDHQVLQSKWFDTEQEAKNWLKTLDWIDTKELVVWLMSSEFDENGDYTDIDFEEDLTNETRIGEW